MNHSKWIVGIVATGFLSAMAACGDDATSDGPGTEDPSADAGLQKDDASAGDAGKADAGKADAGSSDAGEESDASDAGESDASGDDAGGDAAAATFAVGGAIGGLQGTGLVLRLNGGNDLTVAANATSFTFPTALADGADYEVTVGTQPSTPGQICSVTSGSGKIAGAAITNVQVTCATTYSVGGTVSNLVGTLVLTNNGGDDLTLTGDGPFTFTTPVASGSNYQVAVKTQPTSLTCTVDNGGPTAMGTQNVTNVSVTCKAPGASDVLYYFPFDGDTKDYSGNHRDFTNSGGVLTTDRRGNANGAYEFDGSSYMFADGAGLPTGGAARTMTMWVYPEDDNGHWGILHQGAFDCTGLMFGIGRQGGNSTFWGGCNDRGSTSPLPLDTWTFVGIVLEDATTVTIYTGAGAGETFTLGTAVSTPASNLWLGGETTGDSADSIRNYFSGKVDEVRVYGRALTAQEMLDLANLP